ncbi:MAG: aldose 1-epimerase [Phenylobacterium sp.]
MGAPLNIVTLRAQDAPPRGPAFLEAQILPDRGMMLLQARLRLPSGELVDALFAPDADQAAKDLDGGADDFAGNKAFAFGGAILAPYANRIRGRALSDTREIEALIDGRKVRLPRNWGGKAEGAEQYAMHGLILDAGFTCRQTAPDRLTGRLAAGDFGGRWPARTELDVEWRLAAGALHLSIEARNLGAEPLPMGLGWHPYFALPSGDRTQARLRLPAALRAEINDYDEVLPTGRLLPVAGTPFDFNAAAPLGELYLDDCFTDLRREAGQAAVAIEDPASDLGLLVTSASALTKAIQVYAPPDKAFVVVEPQFNLADPFGAEWPAGTDTGMASVPPGGTVRYDAQIQAYGLGNRT